MKNLRSLVLVLTLCFSFGLKPVFAAPDQYDDSQSNPFRVMAYLLYPVAFVTEWTIFRPFHWIVSATPAQEAFFGHVPHPPVLTEPQAYTDYGMGIQSAPREVNPGPPPSPVAEAAPEKVKIVEVEKVVVKEVPKVVEVPKIVEVEKVVEKVVFPTVAFQFDSAELTDVGKGQIYLTSQRLKEKSDMNIVIEGHTDNVGSDAYNQKLGMRRAQTVMNELAKLGIDRSRMSAASEGETQPLINQDNNWARAVNRRVEVQVKAP
jgi:outer membrane protein OmpA-like peptidoglycan-associated protein